MKADCRGVGKQSECKWDGNLDGHLIRCTHHQAEWIQERDREKKIATYRHNLESNTPTPEFVALHAMQSEAMMWLMAGSNHVESQIATLRQYWQRFIDVGGKTWGQR